MPMVLSIETPWSTWYDWRVGTQTAVPASSTGPSANVATYFPFICTRTYTWTRGFWYNGSAPDGTNNISVAVYNEAGTRLATTGNVALSGASVIQSAAFSASVSLPVGTYYMGCMYSVGADANGLFAYPSTALSKIAGLYSESVGSNPMPSSATFATYSAAVVPYIGIARTSFAI